MITGGRGVVGVSVLTVEPDKLAGWLLLLVELTLLELLLVEPALVVPLLPLLFVLLSLDELSPLLVSFSSLSPSTLFFGVLTLRLSASVMPFEFVLFPW